MVTQGLDSKISPTPAPTNPFSLEWSWSILISQECNILLRSTRWMSHWEHTAWENTETEEFLTGSEEPVLHKEIIHPLVVIDFLKIRVYFLSWSPSFPFNTAVLQLGFISVISTCSCRSSCAGLLLSFTCCISPLVMS